MQTDGRPRTAPPEGIEFRTPGPDEFGVVQKVLDVAFNETIDAEELELERQVAEYDRLIVAYDGLDAVGLSGAYTFRLTTPGGEVGAAGVTLVGVLPSHVRRGILRSMMTKLFDDAESRGEAVAVLWASEAAIYQRFGYGLATVSSVLEAPRDRIRFSRPVENPGRIRLVSAEEALATFPPIYDALRPGRPGTLSRTGARWSAQVLSDLGSMRTAFGARVLALFEIDGDPRGYVIYRAKSDWERTGPQHTLTVFELMALDAVAEQALWQYVFGVDLVRTVQGWRNPYPLPLQLMVTEPRRLSLTVNDAMWLRVLDVAKALVGRSYRGPGRLVLEVTDEFRPSNAGRWQVSVDEGGAATVESTSADADLALDISALSSVYLGAFRFAELSRAGRVVELRAGALVDADALVATSTSPWNSTMF